MGFFSRWFKRDEDFTVSELMAPDDAGDQPVLDTRTKSAVMAELDIHQAIAAHERWKLLLEQVLDGTSCENLDPELVCLDDRCDLGKWLHGPGRDRLGKYPAFTLLVSKHKYFHHQAAQVLREAQAGRREEADRLLRTSFQHGSNQVLLLLKELRRGLGLR
ncbi:CZB domain-containing protein [Hydrogenophaga bisanensis]|uniref:CZB domain-containing protein n=1 Tax=Hydrogenophaga bisanensis TaxID=439611 RepID=A0ABW2R849_9BURK